MGDNRSPMIGFYNIEIFNKLLKEITTKNIIFRSDYEITESNYPFSCK